MPAPKKILRSQQPYIYSQRMLKLVQRNDYRFKVDVNGLVCQKKSIDGPILVIVSESLYRAVLYDGRHSLTGGYSGIRKMYNSAGRQFYRPHMALDVYNYVEKYESCHRYRPFSKHQR